MAKVVGRHHHHKHYRVRRAIQERSGGGTPIPGLQLPQRYLTPGPYNFTIYPKGWIFKKLPPREPPIPILGCFSLILLIVACIALVKLFGG